MIRHDHIVQDSSPYLPISGSEHALLVDGDRVHTAGSRFTWNHDAIY